MRHSASVQASPSRGRLALICGMVFLFLVSIAVPPEADARRRYRQRKALPVVNEKKLFERLGGVAALKLISDDWTRRVLADAGLARALQGLEADPKALNHFRSWLSDQTCELADGSCTPAELSGLGLSVWVRMTESEFLVFMDHLLSALEGTSAGEREKNELLARWGSVDRRPDVEVSP